MKNITEVKKMVALRAGMSLRQLENIIAGDTDTTKNTAITLEMVTGINRAVWVFSAAIDRRRRFKQFSDNIVDVGEDSFLDRKFQTG